MDFRMMGFDSPVFNALNHLSHILDTDDYTPSATDNKGSSAPSNAYVRDARAMARTAADVKEYPNSYQFIIDMPGLKSTDIKVQVEDENVLVITGERKREEEKDGVKYLRMERRVGKFMRKFVLPENANVEGISAVCQDGVLTVTVQKLPPPEPKKAKTIELMGELGWCVRIDHCYREANKVADWLANAGLEWGTRLQIVDSPYQELARILMEDARGVAWPRLLPNRGANDMQFEA